MKLSPRTTQILRNFSTISESIVIEPGQRLYTHRDMAIVAWADIEETFDREVSILQLSNFLAVLDRFEDPEISFEKDMAVIKTKKSRVRFKYTSHYAMEKAFKRISGFRQFDMNKNATRLGSLAKDELADIRKVSSALNFEIIQLECKGGVVKIQAVREKDIDGNKYEIGVAGGVQAPDFLEGIDITRLVLANDSYDLYFATAGENKHSFGFAGKDLKVQYRIAVRTDTGRAEKLKNIKQMARAGGQEAANV